MRGVVILLVLLVGCESNPKKPEPRKIDPCKTEYADTVMHCKPREKVRKEDLVKYCEGSSPWTMRCKWIRRDELERILRGI